MDMCVQFKLNHLTNIFGKRECFNGNVSSHFIKKLAIKIWRRKS